jgi:CDP-glucose 4,6-dehydratase
MSSSPISKHFRGVYQGKRVLVTGHTGFKGSWLCDWLIALGAEVGGFSIDVPTTPSHYEVSGLPDKISAARNRMGDIRDLSALQDFISEFKPEVVFHLAAQSLVRESYDSPKTTFDTNVGGTVNVLEALRFSPETKAAVLVATDKCYENLELDYGYRESDRLGGKDPYSASKAASEIAVHSYFLSFFKDNPRLARIASARAGNVIGGGDWAVDRIVPDCMRGAALGQAVSIRNPSSTRPWQHVLEPLSGYLLLGQNLLEKNEATIGEPFNFGPADESTRTVGDLVNEIRKEWPELKILSEGGNSAAKHEAKLLKLSCEKAKERLGWEGVLNFSQAVQMTARWYRGYYHSKRVETSAQISEYCSLALSKGARWTQ